MIYDSAPSPADSNCRWPHRGPGGAGSRAPCPGRAGCASACAVSPRVAPADAADLPVLTAPPCRSRSAALPGMARPARAAPRTLWLLALAGLALPLGQAAVGSEGGAGAGRVGGMRGGATRALSAVTPQPGGAAESPRRLGTSWLTYLYHGDEQYPEMSSCQGREKEVSRCDSLPSCEAVCKPMDCKFSDWGSWLSMGGCVGHYIISYYIRLYCIVLYRIVLCSITCHYITLH